jgi:catechol 2,3-dioxygenase-like lactoylglutathione lyase family enzyme
MPVTCGFNHIATLTPDLDRYQAWYADAFGAVTTHEMPAEGDHPRMAILDLGRGAALNVVEVPEESIVGDRGSIGHRGRIDHFGIEVPDRAALDQVHDRLVTLGADVGEIKQLGDIWSLFFRDVDGAELEVCAPTR